MKFHVLEVFTISLLTYVATAHSINDNSGNSIQYKSSLRGVDLGKVVTGAAVVANHLESTNAGSINANAVEGGKRTHCVSGEEEYFEPDGSIACKKINLKKSAVVVVDDCLPNEEKVVKANGQVVCRKRKKNGAVVVIDDCLPNEEKVIKANGQVVCRKKRSVVVIHDCLPDEEKVVKANGKVVCRKIKNTKRTVVVPRKGPRKNKNTKRNRVVSNDDRGTVVVGDDDDRNVIRRKKNTSTKKVVVAVDDDDDDVSHVIVKPTHEQHSGVIVLDDDDRGVIVDPPDDREPVYGHGTLGPGQDCTNARTSCAFGLVCSPSPLNGSDRWTCQ